MFLHNQRNAVHAQLAHTSINCRKSNILFHCNSFPQKPSSSQIHSIIPSKNPDQELTAREKGEKGATFSTEVSPGSESQKSRRDQSQIKAEKNLWTAEGGPPFSKPPDSSPRLVLYSEETLSCLQFRPINQRISPNLSLSRATAPSLARPRVDPVDVAENNKSDSGSRPCLVLLGILQVGAGGPAR